MGTKLHQLHAASDPAGAAQADAADKAASVADHGAPNTPSLAAQVRDLFKQARGGQSEIVEILVAVAECITKERKAGYWDDDSIAEVQEWCDNAALAAEELKVTQ